MVAFRILSRKNMIQATPTKKDLGTSYIGAPFDEYPSPLCLLYGSPAHGMDARLTFQLSISTINSWFSDFFL